MKAKVPQDPLWKRIQQIDLTMVKLKLQRTNKGEGWSEEKCDRIDTRYRRFLYLSAKYPRATIVPTEAIDTFWHQHILDTHAYARDCQSAIGYFLHHDPYFGLGDDQDQQSLVKAFERTSELYEKTFGEACVDSGGGASTNRGSTCSSCSSA